MAFANYDAGYWLRSQVVVDRGSFKLRLSLILRYSGTRWRGNVLCGNYPPRRLSLSREVNTPQSEHTLSPTRRGLCEYVTTTGTRVRRFTLAAYVMWRLKWIHLRRRPGSESELFYVVLLSGGARFPALLQYLIRLLDHRMEYLRRLETTE